MYNFLALTDRAMAAYGFHCSHRGKPDGDRQEKGPQLASCGWAFRLDVELAGAVLSCGAGLWFQVTAPWIWALDLRPGSGAIFLTERDSIGIGFNRLLCGMLHG